MDTSNTAAVQQAPAGMARYRRSLARIWDQYGMLVIFVILFLLACGLVPNFASWINMKGLGLAVSMSGTLYTILCKCLLSVVAVQAVTELDNKAAHRHAPVPQRHRPFL